METTNNKLKNQIAHLNNNITEYAKQIETLKETNKQLNKTKMETKQTTNKQIKAFNLSESKNLSYDLQSYINTNLFADCITIQKEDRIISYTWNFSPQTTGTSYQKETYKRITIEKKVQTIKETIYKI
jgi:hypothetical protein